VVVQPAAPLRLLRQALERSARGARGEYRRDAGARPSLEGQGRRAGRALPDDRPRPARALHPCPRHAALDPGDGRERDAHGGAHTRPSRREGRAPDQADRDPPSDRDGTAPRAPPGPAARREDGRPVAVEQGSGRRDRHPPRLERDARFPLDASVAHLRRCDRTVDLSDATGHLARRRHAAKPLVAPARFTVGEGPEADPAGPRKPPRHPLDGARRGRRGHARHAGRRIDRLLGVTRLHPDAHPRRGVALRPSS
jgi:hypothetical protein